jgi:phosphoribosylanthranilate isomerase
LALFVNEPKARVNEVLDGAGCRAIWQAAACALWRGKRRVLSRLGCEVTNFRIRERSRSTPSSFPADTICRRFAYGGSGQLFSWEWLEGIDSARILLSGGLRVENVAEAIRKIRPFGVDVCSGVESRPGIKDHGKLKEFIDAAKGA